MTNLNFSIAGFVHRIDPLLADLVGIKIWYYGLAYALGFLGVCLWLGQARKRLGLSPDEVYELSLSFALGALVVGRAFEIAVYEWVYYRDHLSEILSYWRGGMASHGVLLGAALGTWLFCQLRRKRFLPIADQIVIAGAFFLGLGRFGNFINGEIYGRVTDVWWAVKLPEAEGFRHPVALYDGLKNFAVGLLLLALSRKAPSVPGNLLAHFLFWYGFLRIFVDIFRDYPGELLGVGTGQVFNILMAIIGCGLMVAFRRAAAWSGQSGRERKDMSLEAERKIGGEKRSWRATSFLKRIIFVALLLFSLTIPSGWTQGVRKQLEELRERASDSAPLLEVLNQGSDPPVWNQQDGCGSPALTLSAALTPEVSWDG